MVTTEAVAMRPIMTEADEARRAQMQQRTTTATLNEITIHGTTIMHGALLSELSLLMRKENEGSLTSDEVIAYEKASDKALNRFGLEGSQLVLDAFNAQPVVRTDIVVKPTVRNQHA